MLLSKANLKMRIFQLKLQTVLLNILSTNKKNRDQQNDFIVPLYLFEEPEPTIVVKLPFCEMEFVIQLPLL